MLLLPYIQHVAGIPGVLYRVYRQLSIQKAWLKQELEPFLQKTLQENDGSLSEKDISKIMQYYGLAVPAILGEAFAGLRERPLTPNERRGLTWLGATTGLFDDFFENTTLGEDYIENLYQKPGIYTGKNSNEKLANHCWRQALAESSNPALLTSLAAKVHRAQTGSRRQKGGKPDEESLRQITFGKGGHSVLFYMSFFYTAIPAADEKLFYQAGALLQLENDLFDVYKDHQDAINTLVTSGKKIADLRNLYLELWLQTKENLAATSFSAGGKKHFLKILCGLVSRGFVCLDMLQKREIENKGHFDPSVFTRKQLICDMEKPLNLLRTLHYYAKIL